MLDVVVVTEVERFWWDAAIDPAYRRVNWDNNKQQAQVSCTKELSGSRSIKWLDTRTFTFGGRCSHCYHN
jgi:hypothetical protein